MSNVALELNLAVPRSHGLDANDPLKCSLVAFAFAFAFAFVSWQVVLCRTSLCCGERGMSHRVEGRNVLVRVRALAVHLYLAVRPPAPCVPICLGVLRNTAPI